MPPSPGYLPCIGPLILFCFYFLALDKITDSISHLVTPPGYLIIQPTTTACRPQRRLQTHTSYSPPITRRSSPGAQSTSCSLCLPGAAERKGLPSNRLATMHGCWWAAFGSCVTSCAGLPEDCCHQNKGHFYKVPWGAAVALDLRDGRAMLSVSGLTLWD